MDNHNQFLVDFRLLLKKYLTEKAMAKVMAKLYGGRTDNYYAAFLRYLVDPTRIKTQFVEDFYKAFQGDLDELKANGERPANVPSQLNVDSKLKNAFEFIEFQKEHIEDLQAHLDKALDSYHYMIISHRRIVHTYVRLLALFEDTVRRLNDSSDTTPV